MNGIQNIINFISNEWLTLLFGILIIVVGVRELIKFINADREKKVEIILKLLKEEILSYMAQAEIDWKEVEKAGEIKKSQVISKIYERFPILAKYVNQEELLEKISKLIDEQKEKMDKIINK